MIIGVLSDTHSLNLPAPMMERFKTVDLIIHSGDVCDASVIKALKALAPIKAVQGNMDDAALKKQLPIKEIIECEGVKIGITHGHIGEARDAMLNAQAMFKDDHVAIVIFGHSHKATNEKIGDRLFFNSGSPNDVIKAKFFSYGLIEIKDGKIKAEIIKI